MPVLEIPGEAIRIWNCIELSLLSFSGSSDLTGEVSFVKYGFRQYAGYETNTRIQSPRLQNGILSMDTDHQEYLNTILDSIADGVFTIDKERSVTSFNRAAERITGFSRKEAIGRKCYEVFHASICQTACALEKTLRSGREIIDLPINIVSRSGETVPVSISTSVLRNKASEITGGVETFRDLSVIEELKKEITGKYTFEDIISKNHLIQKIFSNMPDIAESDSTVLLEGASGTGKELFARAVHNLSSRRDHPYVAVNCGALPDSLLESELFGYVRGAFTDATRDKPGRFELAEGGTIFLDEVSDMSAASQVRLLRVLQEREYEPLGSTKSKKTNTRVVAATNRSLSKEMNEGRFRTDLYYRLNVIRIELPPLNRRREDIPLLIEHFIRKFNSRTQKRILGVTDDVMDYLMQYAFPGNVRELENIVEHAFVLCHKVRIGLNHLPPEILKPHETVASSGNDPVSPLEMAESKAIVDALTASRGNRRRTAQTLGISKATLWRKMKKYGISF